ncbi:hypothetical protein HQ571_03255 [Candidatus Kuenenbacteria bacterium]|nr:hypothetical protein [Candidatus Kuenenbacteria bacterium]
MENVKPINHLQIVKNDWRKVVAVGLIIFLLSLIFTLIQPFLYRATVSIFVVQKSSFSIDAYSASKSEERFANKLIQVIYSSSFLEKILYSGFDVDKDYFPADELQRRKKWNKTVEANVPGGLSKLEIQIYHPDPGQALQISNAVSYTLTNQKKDFLGIDDVDLKVLDSPLVSKYPVRPNVFLNLFIGIILGIILGIVFAVITYDPEKDRLFGSLKKDEESPHLVDYNEVPEDESVEEEIEEAEEEMQIPEIEELEEVDELDEAEHEAEKPVVEVEEQEIPIPQIPGSGEEDEQEKEIKQNKHADLPKFKQEEEFFGMPDIDEK